MKRGVVTKSRRRSKSVPAKRAAKGKSAIRGKRARTEQPFTAHRIKLLRDSFAMIEPQSGIAAMIFYRNLFAMDPSLRSMFHTSIELQGRKLMDSLVYTVAALEAPDQLVSQLEAMGRRHVTYGTKNEHYAMVVRAMLDMMRECLREKFTSEVESAWAKALAFVSKVMQRGANQILKLTGGKQPGLH